MRPSQAHILALVLLLAGPGVAAAQQTPVATACDYATCALSIAPRWNGLAVIRGARGPAVANLNFFWARDVSAAFSSPDGLLVGADSAVAAARRAVRLRRAGAALTDGGMLLASIAVLRALRAGAVRKPDGVLASIGVAALGVSVPLQFAADGELSRAVWWYNHRFAH